MSNATNDLEARPYGATPLRTVDHPVDGGSTIYKATMVAQLTATGMLVPGSTSASGSCVGVAQHGISNAAGSDGDVRCRVDTDCVYIFANSVGDPCSEATLFGTEIFMEDDHTLAATSSGGTLQRAGYFAGMEPDGHVRVYIPTAQWFFPTISSFVNANHDHEDAAGGGTLDGTACFGTEVDVANGGTGLTTVAAGDVLYASATDTLSALAKGTAKQVLRMNAGATAPEWGGAIDPDLKGTIEIDLGSIADADGDQAKFANGGADGLTVADSKAVCYRINNSGTPPKNICGFGVPADADVTADFTLKFLCSKSGATVGDATTIVVEAFNQVSGALHDADTDYGGTTGALVGNAAAKTLAVLSLTLATANLPAVGSKVSLTFKPTDGTLGTDDLMIHRMWVEYTKKLDA